MTFLSTFARPGQHQRPLRRSSRLGVVAAVVSVVATYAVVGVASPASAASLVGSGFEIETNANLTLEGLASPPAFDWLTAGKTLTPGAKVKADDPSGSGDDSFQSTKEDDNVPFVDAGSIPPSKSDLKQFGVYVEKTGTKTFLNVFWSRVQDPSGSTDMDFEFNQSALTVNGSSNPAKVDKVVPKRTAGDLLLMYSLQSSGDDPVITKAIWVGTAATGHWGPEQALSGTQALGTINSSAITAANSGGLGPFDPFTFGEASVDLAALVGTDQGCVTYGSAYLKSRSGPQFTSELKDFVAPEPVSISNCGKVIVHKTDDGTPANPLAGVAFTITKDQAGTVPMVPPLGCTTDGSGDCTIANVPKGTWWVQEGTPPTGYDKADPQQVVVLTGDQEVPLTFVDPRQTGTVTIVKDAQPNDAQDFHFTLAGTGFDLDDDADGTLSNSRTVTLPTGSYTATESPIPTPWGLVSIACTGGGTTTNVPQATAGITVTKDSKTTCTFVNAPKPYAPPLTTKATAAAGGTWDDVASLTGDGTHAVTGTVTFFACAPAPAAAACTTGGTQVGAPATVTGAGSAYTATTTAPLTPAGAGWTCFRAEYASTSPFYSDTTHTNATTECFLKQAADLTVSKTAHAAYGRLYTWTVDKVVDKARLEVPTGSTATSTYTVTVGNTHVDSAWTVSGTITVTNPNPIAFSGVTVKDAIDNGAGSCAVVNGTGVVVPAKGSIDLGYSCTYAAAPSPSAGTNTATATWDATAYSTAGSSASGTATVDFATVVPATTDETVTVTDSVVGPLGTLDATKDKNPTVFTYTVDRAGVAGTCTAYPNVAAVLAGDSGTRTTDDATVTVCAGADLGAGLSATGTKARDDLWTIDKSVDRTRVALGEGGSATFTYEVAVKPAGVVDSSYALTGTVTATNPNDWEAVPAVLTVSSDVGGGVVCTVTGGSVTVPASGSVSKPFSCSFTSAPAGSGHVTVTVTWNATTAATPHGSATSSTDVAFAVVGEQHSSVTVVDDKTDPANPVTLGVRTHADGPFTYTYSITKAGVAGQCTDYTNTASLTETGQSDAQTVTVCVGRDLTVSKTALATDHRTYLWNIDKDVDATRRTIAAGGTASFAYTVTATPAGVTSDGWTVTGQVVVTNPNAWQAVTATVTDVVDSGGGASCLVGTGVPVSVPASGSVTLPYTCSFTSTPSDGTNTATATWDAAAAATPHGSATGTAPVVFVPSSETNRTVTVVDDKTDPANPVVLGTATYGSAPTVFTYTVDTAGVPGACTDLTNTAGLRETGQSAVQVAQVCVGSALTVAATGAGTFDRDFLWTVDKAVDRTTVTVADGETADFTYTVTATPAGLADSGHELSGVVTVVNPNAWEAVPADVTVTTDLGGGAVCTVTDGVGRTVPAGGSLVLPFACAFTSAPATTGTVTATAAWDAVAASTPAGPATVTAPAVLVLDQVTHGEISVVDDKTVEGTSVDLGTATWADGPAVFTYTLTRTAVGGSCSTATNTATLVETAQTATADAELCGTVFTGGGGGVTVPPVVPPVTSGGGGGLVFTGDWSGAISRWALAMLLAGAALTLLGRRRQA